MIVNGFFIGLGIGFAVLLIIVVGVVASLTIEFVFIVLPRAVRQARCVHERYYETMACDAICMNCDKNLGFIAEARKLNPKGELLR